MIDIFYEDDKVAIPKTKEGLPVSAADCDVIRYAEERGQDHLFVIEAGFAWVLLSYVKGDSAGVLFYHDDVVHYDKFPSKDNIVMLRNQTIIADPNINPNDILNGLD